MKLITKISAAMLTLGVVASASADNVVYLTGSTAFRSIVYNALSSGAGTNAGGVFDSTPQIATRKGTSASGASYMLFHGNINGTPTFIDCVWSGSEAGIASAANISIINQDRDGNDIPLAGSPATWLKADGSVAYTIDTANTDPAVTGELEGSSRGADLAQADTSQAVSLTPYVANTSTALKDYGKQGVVTFTWAKNKNTVPASDWSALVNLTLPQVHRLLAQGYQPSGFFTGNSANTNLVYLVGRNKGSGTRANTLADHNYGTTTKPVQQFSIGRGVNPGDAFDGSLLLQYENNNGYESGGDVAKALAVNGSCQQPDPYSSALLASGVQNPYWMAVGYLGCGDALKITGDTSTWLSLDGVMESNGAIIEGQYYFWGYEHLFGKSGISGYQDQAGNLIQKAVTYQLNATTPAASGHDGGIGLQFMHCQKATDVSFPTRL